MRNAIAAGAAFLIVAGLGVSSHPAVAQGPAGPDFAHDVAANKAAADLADAFASAATLSREFAGTQITSAGLQINVAGAVSSDVTAAVAVARLARKRTAADVPVLYRRVKYSWSTLLSVYDALNAQASELFADGLQATSWGPDVSSNTVVLRLSGGAPTAGPAVAALDACVL